MAQNARCGTIPVSVSSSLTDGPVSRVLLRFAFPIFCSYVLQNLNGSVNAFWVGRYLGEAALTAVVNAHSVIALLAGASLGISSAATILVGQYIGSNQIRGAKRVVKSGLAFFIVVAIVMSIVGIALTEPVLISMRTPPAALPLAVTYIKVMFVALPSIYTYAFLNSLLLGSGDSRTSLTFMLLFLGLGASLNPVFIFGAGPIPSCGVAGAAIASFVAQTVSASALIFHLYRRGHPLCLYKSDFEAIDLHWSIIRTLIIKGIPIGAQVLVPSLSAVLMVALVNRFGDDMTAAYAASMQLWTYVQIPAVAIAMAVSAMTAQNVGAQRWDRVRLVTHVGVIYGVGLTVAVVCLAYTFESYALGLFLPVGSPALRIASHVNGIVMWSFVLLGVSVVLFGAVRGFGAVMASLGAYALSLLVVRFAVAASLLDAWLADAVWWSFPVSHFAASLLAALYYRYGNWRAAYRGLLPVVDVRESGRIQ